MDAIKVGRRQEAGAAEKVLPTAYCLLPTSFSIAARNSGVVTRPKCLNATLPWASYRKVAGNAPPLTAVDPVTGVGVRFPDLEVENELFDKALIMPEPCPFLSRSLPIVSIIRPTKT